MVRYPAKTSKEFTMHSRSKTSPLKKQEQEIDKVFYQLSTPRKMKKSKTLKSLTRNKEKVAD